MSEELPSTSLNKKNECFTTETGEKSPAKSNLKERNIKSNDKKITDKELVK
ncbi:6904_t:CDS:2 [Funneliformis mosseae]|uniref:6904_t:CDS:1 n=1 Tax=Funneliformis mosseae TaxID=27381 RepID=A0A9N8Z8Y6_FUNMO|nr:6904_t:CDS:2 [Funneliformis mosseae]